MSKNLFILILSCLVILLFCRVIATDARVVELLNAMDRCECLEK